MRSICAKYRRFFIASIICFLCYGLFLFYSADPGHNLGITGAKFIGNYNVSLRGPDPLNNSNTLFMFMYKKGPYAFFASNYNKEVKVVGIFAPDSNLLRQILIICKPINHANNVVRPIEFAIAAADKDLTPAEITQIPHALGFRLRQHYWEFREAEPVVYKGKKYSCTYDDNKGWIFAITDERDEQRLQDDIIDVNASWYISR